MISSHDARIARSYKYALSFAFEFFSFREAEEKESHNDVHTVCSLSKVKMQMPDLLV